MPIALRTSWLPSIVITAPPATAASLLSVRSSCSSCSSSSPRSSTSPICTSTVLPPIHRPLSYRPATRSTRSKTAQSPCRSPTATRRSGIGSRRRPEESAWAARGRPTWAASGTAVARRARRPMVGGGGINAMVVVRMTAAAMASQAGCERTRRRACLRGCQQSARKF
eukprot:scaffold5422_cov63-Phaeocystis_antarctica.AAC.4